MADTTPSLAPGGADPFTSLAGSIQSKTAQTDAALAGKSDAALDAFTTKLTDAEQKRDKGFGQLSDDRSRILPPVPAKPEPLPTEKVTDPKQAWGSAAMMVAMFGSLLTRTPMNSALNAAAGVLKSFHQGDLEEAERQFKTWQVNSTNATKQFEYEQQAYSRILAEFDRREKMTGAEYDSAVRAAAAEFRGVATSFKDQVALAAYDMGGVKAVGQLMNDRANFNLRLQENETKVADNYYQTMALHEWAASDDGQRAMADMKSPDRATQLRGARAYNEFKMGSDPKFAEGQQAKGDAAVKSYIDDVEKGPLGKTLAYNQEVTNVSIDKALDYLRHHPNADPATDTALKDIFTKGATGGQAIRQFMVNMASANTPYKDQISKQVSLWDTSGGGMDRNQAMKYLGWAKAFRDGNNSAVAKQVDARADLLDSLYPNMGFGDNLRQYFSTRGVSTHHTDTSSATHASSERDHEAWPKPPQANVDALKANPQLAATFDGYYGPGAAERILGKGGATGHGSSGTFPASQ